jgi:phosphate-selective porin OprO and OprP
MSLVELYAPTILAAIFLGFFLLPAQAQSASTQSPDDKIQQLEQKVDDLDQRLKVPERLKEIKTEEDADKAKSTASVTANGGPFTIRSGDGNFILRIGADFQIDNRTFTGVSSVPLTDQILIRRARPTISGTVYKYVDFYVRPDFGQGQVVLYEAYTQLNYFSRFNLRVGKFKPPVGLERLQSDDDTNFIERGLPTLLAPSRDIGYQLSGDIVKNRVNYAVGVFNGVPDNSLSDASVTDHRDYAARIFLTPFLPETKSPLSGLGVGIGASSGSVDGLTLPAYKTLGQNTFFTFASGVTSAGHRTRLAPQAYYYLGPFGVLTEYTLAEEGFQKGTVRRDIALRSWQVQASYLLTGEKKVFGTLVPKKAFDPRNHGWGAFELAVRVGDFSVEQRIYNYGFASPTTSPRRAHEWVGGVSWYLNRMLRISLDYGNTNFGGGATVANGGNRPSERVLLNRFQVNF